MTKKQALKWVQSNCAFAMSTNATSMVKAAATDKGLQLDDKAIKAIAVFAMAHAMLKKAELADEQAINVALADAFRALGPDASVFELTNRVVDTILTTKQMPKGSEQYFRNRPALFKQVQPQAALFLKTRSKDEMAKMYQERPEKAVGPNPPPPARTRLSPPPMRGTTPPPKLNPPD